MAPKSQANAAPQVRLDLPWALGTLANSDTDAGHLLQALNFLLALDLSPHQQDLDVGVQLITLVTPHTAASDTQVNAAAIKMLTRLVAEGRGALREAFRQPASLQALWSVLSDFHAVFDDYLVLLATMLAEAADPGLGGAGGGRGTGAGGGGPGTAGGGREEAGRRPVKGTPPPPVDPESSLPGPSKYALEAVLVALSAAMGAGGGPTGQQAAAAAEQALLEVVGRRVGPLVTLLRHNSLRIQLLALRFTRLLLRCAPLAGWLAGGGCLAALTQLVGSSGSGAVREEAMTTASHIMAAHAPSMQLALDAGLPSALLHLLLAPATGQAVPPAPPPSAQQLPQQQPPVTPQGGAPRTPSDAGAQPGEGGQLRPGSSSEDAAGGSGGGAGGEGAGGAAAGGVEAGQLDFARPVQSSPEKLQDQAAQLLLQLCRHHHGACQHLLRLGALQLLLTQLPAPPAHTDLYNQLHNPQHQHHQQQLQQQPQQQQGGLQRSGNSMKAIGSRNPSASEVQLQAPPPPLQQQQQYQPQQQLLQGGRMSPMPRSPAKSPAKGRPEGSAGGAVEEGDEEEEEEVVDEEQETRKEQRARETWQPFLEGPPALPLPGCRTPTPSHNLQATLLLLLSCLLSEPGVQQHWWAVGGCPAPPHLVPLFHLGRQPPAPPPPAPRSESSQKETIAPNRRSIVAPPPPPPPPDPTQPPFPAHVRAAALQCLLQLLKQRRWLAAAPFMAALQDTLRSPDSWGPEMVAPLAEILQRIAQARRPRPKAASAAAAGAVPAPEASAAAAGPPPPRQRPCFPAPPSTSALLPPPPPPPPPPATHILSSVMSLSSMSIGSGPKEDPAAAAAAAAAAAVAASASATAGLAEEELSDEELLAALKALAALARRGISPWATSSVAAALLTLPQTALFAPPWPPLPSPPPTPPPPPLPTSQYLWDALGRPVMTDGVKLMHL
ncbi:hypothetical protein Agub_g5413 [Astrephomene gubernaculifera]|uniref:Uncharacterized protein n=1 Tax=Astrephomene gubernaculifera TaxID=47775 RepID=A0AAD3HK32_9CHLO|nr:hypothetical protein Agub_g5413 [Astrephomene gubernaculifera]